MGNHWAFGTFFWRGSRSFAFLRPRAAGGRACSLGLAEGCGDALPLYRAAYRRKDEPILDPKPDHRKITGQESSVGLDRFPPVDPNRKATPVISSRMKI